MLINISIETERDTFNPLLEPGVTGDVCVWGHYSDKPSEKICTSEVTLSASTKLASGEQVIRLEDERIIPIEGGLGCIKAVVIEEGKTFYAHKDIVVRPFYHEYHQKLVLAIFNIHPKHHTGIPTCTFEETLEGIIKTNTITRGVPMILHLMGYQDGGFDQLFPAWLPVDPRLKRKDDKTALESLRWLIREARKYNTIVTLHIDMIQAFTQSPLWDEYKKKDVLSRDENGDIILMDNPNVPHDKMNWTSYTREWEEGLAQRRIDGLLEAIPELLEGHTIHLDNLNTYVKAKNRPISPWHAKPENGGIDMYKEVETIRKIFRYFKDKGMSVTGEGILWAHPPGEGFYGIQGYSWWGRGSEHSMQVPERLSARGATSRNEISWDPKPSDFRVGSSIHGSSIWMKDMDTMPGLLHQFCTMSLPYFYLSQYDRLDIVNDVLYYSGGLVAGEFDGRKIIKQGNYVLVEDGNIFVQAIWKRKEIIAYSVDGYNDKCWTLPNDWKDTTTVDLYRITLEGLESVETRRAVDNGKLWLSVGEGEAISIVPHGYDL
jgi:hypothetical protein